MSQLDKITEQFSRHLTGWAISKAILEDYCRVISTIENVPHEKIEQRILKRADEYFQEAQKSILKKK